MRQDLRELTLPFPPNLMATAQSPLALPTTYARDLTNMLLAPDGSGTKRNGVVAIGSALVGEEVTGVFTFQASSGSQLLVVTAAGRLLRQNGSAWDVLYTGLNGTGMPMAVLFGGQLILCNGLNPLLQYNGTAVSVVERLVRDVGTGLTFLAPTQLRINSQASLYIPGQGVRVKVNGADVLATVQSATQSGAQTIVTLTTPVLATPLTEVWFTVRPPTFARLHVAHDRLWGFGAGGLEQTLGSSPDRLRVYYTHGVNDASSWPDPTTGITPSLNLADKAGQADELLAMRVKDGMTVFMARNHMQLWAGTTPGTSGGLAADFGWVKTIPVGLAHPAAVLDLPNDLLLLTPLGARTLSRTLQTEQLDLADVGRSIDPTLARNMQHVQTSVTDWRRVQAFSCPSQQWFALGFEGETLVWQVAAMGGGWARFDGIFSGLSASHTATDGSVYLASFGSGEGQVYRYDPDVWADAGTPFTTLWWVPWIAPAGQRRWANKYAEVLAVPQIAQTVTLKRYTNLDDGNPRVAALELPAPPDYWDTAMWDAGLFDNAATPQSIVRDHAVAERFSFAVESTHDKPLKILGLRLYGVAERI